MKRVIVAIIITISSSILVSCNASLDEILLVGDTEIPYSKMALNMFPRNTTAGDLATQMADVKSLGINFIRVNFWFDTQYMPTSGSVPDFSQFDAVVAAAAAEGISILALLNPVPEWLVGNPSWKSIFVDQYVTPVVSRYKNSVKYWEVYNEPNEETNGFTGTADDYFDLLKQVSIAIRAEDPTAKVVAGATSNIVLYDVGNWEYTQRLVDLGLETYADVLNIHYYSELDIELSVVGGALVQSVNIPNWVTETGKFGQSNQKDYFESIMPYIEKSLGPEKIFWYCYVEGVGSETVHPDDTFGLVTYHAGQRSESSLYTLLKNQ